MWAMRLFISSTMLAELQRLAKAGAPQEICGILFGADGRVSGYQATANVAGEPLRHFEIDPRALIAAEREQRRGGDAIVGFYHSHPGGRVEPSRTDAQCAAPDGRIWLIVNGEDAAAWQTAQKGEVYGRFDAIGLDCPEATGQTTAK